MKQLLHSLILVAVMSPVIYPQTSQESLSLEEITQAGNAAIATGDWARAESHFRQAVKLAPKQGFWRIQLVLVLGQQKKWKAAFEEMEPLARNGATDWIVTANRNLPDGKVAFIESDRFRNERGGIPRYVAALKKTNDVNAVAQDIGVKFDAFADEHKLALVYDISKFKALPFEKGGTLDATSDFIAYYNSADYTQKYYGTVYLYRGVDTVNYGTQIVVLNPEAVVFLDGRDHIRKAYALSEKKIKLQVFEVIRRNPNDEQK
jgi:tetratricopeptide (TPR) repeat protein